MRNPLASDRIRDAMMFLAVGILSFVVHEAAHWLSGTILGYDMIMTLNRVWSKTGTSERHGILIVAAGPLLTIVQGLAGFGLAMNRHSRFGFAVLYMAFCQRLLATVVTLSKPNDESKVSLYLGLGKWALPLIVSGSLFLLVLIASRRMKFRLKDHRNCFMIASLAITMVIVADRFLFSKP